MWQRKVCAPSVRGKGKDKLQAIYEKIAAIEIAPIMLIGAINEKVNPSKPPIYFYSLQVASWSL
jgi:hypothetical protein